MHSLRHPIENQQSVYHADNTNEKNKFTRPAKPFGPCSSTFIAPMMPAMISLVLGIRGRKDDLIVWRWGNVRWRQKCCPDASAVCWGSGVWLQLSPLVFIWDDHGSEEGWTILWHGIDSRRVHMIDEMTHMVNGLNLLPFWRWRSVLPVAQYVYFFRRYPSYTTQMCKWHTRFEGLLDVRYQTLRVLLPFPCHVSTLHIAKDDRAGIHWRERWSDDRLRQLTVSVYCFREKKWAGGSLCDSLWVIRGFRAIQMRSSACLILATRFQFLVQRRHKCGQGDVEDVWGLLVDYSAVYVVRDDLREIP